MEQPRQVPSWCSALARQLKTCRDRRSPRTVSSSYHVLLNDVGVMNGPSARGALPGRGTVPSLHRRPWACCSAFEVSKHVSASGVWAQGPHGPGGCRALVEQRARTPAWASRRRLRASSRKASRKQQCPKCDKLGFSTYVTQQAALPPCGCEEQHHPIQRDTRHLLGARDDRVHTANGTFQETEVEEKMVSPSPWPDVDHPEVLIEHVFETLNQNA